MSDAGPSETSRVGRSPPIPPALEQHVGQPGNATAHETMFSTDRPTTFEVPYRSTVKNASVQTSVPGASPIEMRVHFDDFAAQLRLHRHAEHKRWMLEHRKARLQRAVALSGRLRRLSFWLHDGLFEISRVENDTDFVRVHQHILDLTDRCLSDWDDNARLFDPLRASSPPRTDVATSFLSQLSPASQHECVDFIHNIRTNPRFLVDRFKAVSPSQLVAFSAAPKYTELHTTIGSLSSHRGRSSQKKRIQSYAKTLEEYASTFERKNPLSFLLHNCYASGSVRESLLRLETWSSICATLYLESRTHFLPFFHHLLWEFAGLGGWRARDRIELFLMDVLQRGAFLLEPVGDYKKGSLDSYIADTLETDEARKFFSEAVQELFELLASEDGGFPSYALDLVRSIMVKLPDQGMQSDIRGHVVFDWFFQYFLVTAIVYPENQKMLLRFHVSDSARSIILTQLWQRATTKGKEIMSQEFVPLEDQAVLASVHQIINHLSEEEAPPATPYQTREPFALSICASDLVSVLEALSQQYTNVARHFEPFMHSSMDAFNAVTPRSNPKLDRLRRELQLLFEPGYSLTTVLPVSESWLSLQLTEGGNLQAVADGSAHEETDVATMFSSFKSLTPADQAVIRLASCGFTHTPPLSLSSSSRTAPTLREMCIERERDSRSRAEMVEAQFWDSAIDFLDENYPIRSSDTRILRPLVNHLSKLSNMDALSPLESELVILEDGYKRAKEDLVRIQQHFEHLKIKLWYTMSVTNSSIYEDTRNISKALNYMVLPPQQVPGDAYSLSSGSGRPGTSASTASSLFEQPRLDTMRILRASQEHGGPKKLADEQIDLTKKWLERNSVDNFCKGEERIHRFCMEIRLATKKLVAESIAESPDLWSSALWAAERNRFNTGMAHFPGPVASTRPSSVISETFSAPQWARPSLGGSTSSRSLEAETVGSFGRRAMMTGYGSTRINRNLLEDDLASSFTSPVRTGTNISATESLSSVLTPHSQARSQGSASQPSQTPSIWSQSSSAHPSQTRSQTSMSFSRPPSVYNDAASAKANDVEKARFIETMREGLLVLLLSDLSNPVWSLGSETDFWLNSYKSSPQIAQRLLRRRQMSELLPAQSRGSDRPRNQRRTWSADDCQGSGRRKNAKPVTPSEDRFDERCLAELGDVLRKISRQVRPGAKLQGIYEFRQVALTYLERQSVQAAPSLLKPRRQSLGPGVSGSKQAVGATSTRKTERTDKEIRDYLRDVLLVLEPKTLFRDLQYIASFSTSEALNNSESGRAFVQVGLAALASKDEVCRTMVELADKIVARDAIKRKASSEDADNPLGRAREYWIIAAKEGNAVAQRELASLYLAHPEVSVPPTVTAPLTKSTQVFKDSMMWRSSESVSGRARQALCLALHWMQQAAAGGDSIAKQKLEERKGQSMR
jgi:hypothetical protein